METRVKDWRELFTVEQLPEDYSPLPTQPGECNSNCQLAKELVCVCRCGGKNHGAHLKAHVRPLDRFNEPQQLEAEVIAA